MRVQHNIMAMNAYRNYTNNVSAMKKNLEKLSSGYKINRAGDDAAGLAISEKMRAQITGLKTAQKNAKDGISLVQTAEGAMTEVHDMLNRMVELATQSANGTYESTTDRTQLQKEINQLRDEINRIADSANFNGIKLLDGSMDGALKSVNNADLIKDANVLKDGQLGKNGQAGEFVIDLTNASVTGQTTGSKAAITFKIFNKTLTLATASAAKDKTFGDEDLAKLIAEKWTAQAADDKKFGGVAMTAEAVGSKVTFKMQGAPTADLTTAGTGVFGGQKFTSQGEQVVVTPIKEPIKAGASRQYAQAEVTVAADMVKDGKTLKIGDTTYVIAQGKNSKYKGAENVIDLTDIEESTLDAKITDGTVGMRIANAAKDNTNFKVGSYVAATGAAKITFTEKEGGVDYAKNNLAGDDGKGTGDGTTTKDATEKEWAGLIQSGDVDTSAKGKALTLQIGDTADSFNQLKVSIGDIHVDSLGIGSISVADQESAAAAVDAIKAAINKVSDIRGTLGATQNRLDHTINNLSVMTENIQDAESTIRDVDIAEEMMAYTKNNILIQSAQAMLAQANQVPQGVLQLLG